MKLTRVSTKKETPMKKLLPLLILTYALFSTAAALACTVAPQPVGHAGDGTSKVFKIVGSGSSLLVTYGNPNGFNTTSAIQFGTGSGMTFVGTWVSSTGLLTSMVAASHSWPDSPGGGGALMINNSGTTNIEIHGGVWLGPQGNWNQGVTDITGLGLGQQRLEFRGSNNGVLVTSSYKAIGYCSSFAGRDGTDDAILALLPAMTHGRRLWWESL